MQSQRFTIGHSLRVIFALGWSDFVLKYRGSFLGYLWSIAVPFVKFLVIYHVFRPFATSIPQYPLYLFLGLILWEHFSMTTTACITVLMEKQAIVRTIPFPRVLLLLASGWTNIIILTTYVMVFFLMCVLIRHTIPLSALWYLPIVFVQVTLLALGIGMVLSSFSLRFRDIPHLWVMLLQIIFWLTPIMYVYEPQAPVFAEMRRLLSDSAVTSLWSLIDVFIRFQPLSLIIHDARRALLYPELWGLPTAFHILSLTLVCGFFFVIGISIFNHRSRYFVEEY